MNAFELEEKLAAVLRSNQLIGIKDYTVSLDPAGIIIDRDGHVKGIWQYCKDIYEWTPAGYNEPTARAGTIEEALTITLQQLGIL